MHTKLVLNNEMVLVNYLCFYDYVICEEDLLSSPKAVKLLEMKAGTAECRSDFCCNTPERVENQGLTNVPPFLEHGLFSCVAAIED